MAHPIHPAAELWPALDPEEYRVLLDGIRETGLEAPILRWRGQIVDGVHRYRACQELGVEPIFKDEPDDADPWMLAARGNGGRRHILARKRASIVHLSLEKSETWKAELMRLREKDANHRAETRSRASAEVSSPPSGDEKKPKSRTHLEMKVAGLAGVSPGTLDNRRSVVVEALGRVYLRYGNGIDQSGIVAWLAKLPGGAAKLAQQGKSLRDTHGGTIPYNIADVIVLGYNRKRRAGKLERWRS